MSAPSTPCDPAFPLCAGHLGKFSDCLSEALYEQAAGTVGWADDEGGTTEFEGYMWLILGHESIEIPAADWSGDFDIKTAPGTWLTLLTTDQGFVYLTAYGTRDEAQDAYDTHIAAYDAWDAANDEYEHAIIHGQIAGVY